MDKSFQISTGGDYCSLYLILAAQMCNYSGNCTIFGKNFRYLCLLHVKVFLHFTYFFHMVMVLYSVCLYPETVHRRSLSPVEHTALNKTSVGGFSHFTAESVYLADKMTLCSSSYRRIAWHICNIVQRYCKHDRFCAKPRCSQSCLNSRVSRSDNSHIVAVYIVTHFLTSQIRKNSAGNYILIYHMLKV